MSLMDRPSPSPRLITPDPKRWGQRYDTAQREAHKAQVRAYALAAGHPSCAPYDHEAESSLPTLMLPMVSTLEASLIVTALRGSAFVPCRELGERIEADLRARRDDWTPADGIPRGTA
jgi:hypothetical protein